MNIYRPECVSVCVCKYIENALLLFSVYYFYTWKEGFKNE